MKISKKARDHLPNNPTSPVNHYFPYCCPENGMQVAQPSFLPKKAHKFIKLTLLK